MSSLRTEANDAGDLPRCPGAQTGNALTLIEQVPNSHQSSH